MSGTETGKAVWKDGGNGDVVTSGKDGVPTGGRVRGSGSARTVDDRLSQVDSMTINGDGYAST